MIYLHDSEIISHGNLRSSNCLIDSRWVLQIADFGLHEFKGNDNIVDVLSLLRQEIIAGQEDPDWVSKELRRSLWRAPELIRMINKSPRGTQKGDVYSFAIVLYEIIGRSGPWGTTDLSEAGKNDFFRCCP